MKLPFRFFRGELNGFFLYRLATFMNIAIQSVLDELVYWSNVQFKTAGTTNPGELPMRDKDILGIAVVAGVFTPYLTGGTWYGMMFMSDTHVVSGVEYSERGLYSRADNHFIYIRTDASIYADDISTQASPLYRMALVPDDAPILGYVRADEDLYDTDGNVILAHVYPTPPVDVAYEPFYGENYLTLSLDAPVHVPTPIELTVELVELLQFIRANGTSIKTFLDLTAFAVEDYVQNISITYSADHYLVTYNLNGTSTLDNPLQRYNLWLLVVSMKFKLFELSEI